MAVERTALEMGADGHLVFVASGVAIKPATVTSGVTTKPSLTNNITIKSAVVAPSTSFAAGTHATNISNANQNSLYKLVAEARASSASNSDDDVHSLRVQLASARRTIASLQKSSPPLPPHGDSLSTHAAEAATERCALLEGELASVKRERMADRELHAALQRVREAEIAEVASLRRLLADAQHDMQVG